MEMPQVLRFFYEWARAGGTVALLPYVFTVHTLPERLVLGLLVAFTARGLFWGRDVPPERRTGEKC